MKPNSKRQAGTKADSSKKDDVYSVRQHSSKPLVVCSCLESKIILSAVRYILLTEYERLRDLRNKYEGTKNELKYEYRSRAVRDVKNMVNNYLKTKGVKIYE